MCVNSGYKDKGTTVLVFIAKTVLDFFFFLVLPNSMKNIYCNFGV